MLATAGRLLRAPRRLGRSPPSCSALHRGRRRVARDVDADGYLQVPFSDAEVLDVLGATRAKRKLILLADDSPLIHRHTVPILEEAGYEVVSAHDGEEALERSRERTAPTW